MVIDDKREQETFCHFGETFFCKGYSCYSGNLLRFFWTKTLSHLLYHFLLSQCKRVSRTIVVYLCSIACPSFIHDIIGHNLEEIDLAPKRFNFLNFCEENQSINSILDISTPDE